MPKPLLSTPAHLRMQNSMIMTKCTCFMLTGRSASQSWASTPRRWWTARRRRRRTPPTPRAGSGKASPCTRWAATRRRAQRSGGRSSWNPGTRPSRTPYVLQRCGRPEGGPLQHVVVVVARAIIIRPGSFLYICPLLWLLGAAGGGEAE
ncbi:unnamed protein product [Heterosigma akashiwo]